MIAAILASMVTEDDLAPCVPHMARAILDRPRSHVAPRPVNSALMSEITHLLDAAAAGDRQAAADLLPLVYDELRKLAAARMTAERPGHTLDATALVHE